MQLSDLLFLVVGTGALIASLLPRWLDGKPVSLPFVFLAAGMILAALPGLPLDVQPSRHDSFIEHFTETVVIISLMGAGLGVDRRVGLRRWGNTWRLLGIAMPLTIIGVGVLGWSMLGLAPAAAVLLGAALAPTDPVLAGEVQVGEPASDPIDDEDAEDEVRFSLTSEAGLNDALAFPFVYLAITMMQKGNHPGDWWLRWFAVDVLYRISVGLVGGLAVGWLLSRLFFSAPRKVFRLAEHREGLVAIAATFLAYGATELAQGYGFLAVFVTAVTIRGSERFHSYHVVLHRFVEQAERLLTVLLLLLLGAALSDGLIARAGWREATAAAVVLLIIRPVAAGFSMIGATGSKRERTAIAFFGVRGVGSVYYAAYGFTAAGFLAERDAIYVVVGLVIAGSVVLHGATAGPIMRKLYSPPPPQAQPGTG